MTETENGVVIDNGSGFTRAGFFNDEEPISIFPTCVGRPKHLGYDVNMNTSRVGNQTQKLLGILNLKFPMEYGIVKDWYNMEKIWDYTFELLRCSSENCPVLLTESPLNPKSNREKTTKIMFEKFGVSRLFLANRSVLGIALGLNTNKKDTGIVLNCGKTITTVVPIYMGYVIPHAIMSLKFGGQDLTNFLVEMLNNREYSLTTPKKLNDVNTFKEKQCYVAMDFCAEMAKVKSDPVAFRKTCQLYNNEKVELNHERFRCPEALFDPTLFGKDWPGIHQIVKKSVDKCDPELRSTLYENIVLTGGSTLFPGFPERLEKEVQALAPDGTQVHVNAWPNRSIASWIGGSIVSLCDSSRLWITPQVYYEEGPEFIHKMEIGF